jgi:hypothetical protein
MSNFIKIRLPGHDKATNAILQLLVAKGPKAWCFTMSE